MNAQQILWNILMLAMLTGAIYAAWVVGGFEMGTVAPSPASGRSLVVVAKPPEQERQTKEKKPKTPKAHSPKHCPLCCAEGLGASHECHHHALRKYDHSTWRRLIPWSAARSAQGRPKKSDTEGRCCHNEACYYWGVTNSAIHALVYDGGRHLADGERVRLLKCQNCGSKFCGRRDTAMYWLKTSTKEVSRVMRALAEGVSISGTARIFEHGRPSIQRWANLGAAHMSKLHERMFSGLQAVTVQLDEIRTRIKGRAEATWVWVAFEAKSKLRLATHIGERTHNDAHTLIHKLKQTLADDCVPVFSSDGLKFYAEFRIMPSKNSNMVFGSAIKLSRCFWCKCLLGIILGNYKACRKAMS